MMLDGNAIEVRDIRKSFKLYFDKSSTLKEKAIYWHRNKYELHEVLAGISFDVKKGEAVGLIGHNGCGKSTTLKLLTRIMYPDSGSITVQGRVSSLLELGAGFHPDMSGRENIYMNASIFGLSRKEIDARLEGIIAFSELREFIDNPVRTYSSGMYMRLAFSVAINVDADILLIDEILAVGDVNFQDKCFHRLMEIKKNGTTIVLVSHSTDQIERLCERSIWIHEGMVKADGRAREVDQQYLKYMGRQKAMQQCGQEAMQQKNGHEAMRQGQSQKAVRQGQSQKGRQQGHSQKAMRQDGQESAWQNGGNGMHDAAGQDQGHPPAMAGQDQGHPLAGEALVQPAPAILKDHGPDVEYKDRMAWTGDIRITCINSYGGDGVARNVFETGEKVIFKVSYRVIHPVKNSYFGLSIFRNDGLRCYGTNSKIDGLTCGGIDRDGEFSIEFPAIGLLQGKYYVDVCIATKEDEMLDYLDCVNAFEVYCTSGELGIGRIPYAWDLSTV